MTHVIDETLNYVRKTDLMKDIQKEAEEFVRNTDAPKLRDELYMALTMSRAFGLFIEHQQTQSKQQVTDLLNFHHREVAALLRERQLLFEARDRDSATITRLEAALAASSPAPSDTLSRVATWTTKLDGDDYFQQVNHLQ